MRTKKIMLYLIILFFTFFIEIFFSIESYARYCNVPLTFKVDCCGAKFIKNGTGEQTLDSFTYSTNIIDCIDENTIGKAKIYFEGSNDIGWSLCIYYEIGKHSFMRKKVATIINKDMSGVEENIVFTINPDDNIDVFPVIHIYGMKELPSEAIICENILRIRRK